MKLKTFGILFLFSINAIADHAVTGEPNGLGGIMHPTTPVASQKKEVSVTDYIKKSQWVGSQFQYGDVQGNWHNPLQFYVATKEGEFLNSSKESVSYQVGDILFKATNGSWYKADPKITKQILDYSKTIINPENVELSPTEIDIIHFTNMERITRGIPPLVIKKSNMADAREKSKNMAASNSLSHGLPPAVTNGGENISWNYGNGEGAVAGWMASKKGHREAILNPRYKTIGVGMDERNNGPYYTQRFGW